MREKTLLSDLPIFIGSLDSIDIKSKIIISTINAHSFNQTFINRTFKIALQDSNILLSDGISIVWAIKFLTGIRIKKIAGADIFYYLVNELNKIKGKCFFLGASIETLKKIKIRLENEYPQIDVDYYSPPFKQMFDDEDNRLILKKINHFKPHVLFVGMTAPKQEIWVYEHKDKIQANIKCSIGAVFDFYAGSVKRAPYWIINLGFEWLYRFIKEPRRLWKRYLWGNLLFILRIFKIKLFYTK